MAGAPFMTATKAPPRCCRPIDVTLRLLFSAACAVSAFLAVAAEPRLYPVPNVSGFEISEDMARIPLVRHWDAERPEPDAPGAAMIAWDDEYLYAACDFSDSDLIARVEDADGQTHLDDVFELFLKRGDEAPHYFEFHVTPAGITRDLKIDYPRTQDFEAYTSWDAAFESDVRLRGTLNNPSDTAEGWSAVMRIPWDAILRDGERPKPGDTWLFAVCRYNYTTNATAPEHSSTARLATLSFHRVEDYDLLVLVDEE